MPSYRSLAFRAGLLASVVAPPVTGANVNAGQAANALPVPSVPPRNITWARCDAQRADAAFRTLLADRLRCGVIRVPRDHHRPAEGDITLSVVRVAAAAPALRQGALFVNQGGPGGDPGQFATMLAAIWMHAQPDDPIHGEKKRLGDAFDLIAVVPRGLPGSTP